ncbi:MAG: hypothetical protein ACOCWG_00445 [bacterium]
MIKKITKIAAFTLFHHNKEYNNKHFAFYTGQLQQFSKLPNKYSIKDISDTLYKIVTKTVKDFKDKEISLTLTGGMDSRLILAGLIKAGVKPNCLTFGNSQTRDVFFAEKITKKLGLNHHNTVGYEPTKDWYYEWVMETIKRDKGNAHLHRAHRTAAIAEHAEKYSPKALFTGHMGGEGLRGLSYNNYFASPFFEWVNEGKMNVREAAKRVLSDYFIKTENIDLNTLIEKVKELPWMKHDKETNKLYFLYNLVAKIHHAQDIRLYQSYVPEVVPVFLQKDYLETLFQSPYNFMTKKNNILSRLRNPEIYCKVLEYLYPPLLDYPLANGFTPGEYLKGLWYYVPVKMYRDYKNKKKYPPTFSYGQWYVDFVKEHAENISPEIWKIYDKDKYMHALYNNKHRTDEGYWHKFSNPIFFDLVEKYKKGELT